MTGTASIWTLFLLCLPLWLACVWGTENKDIGRWTNAKLTSNARLVINVVLERWRYPLVEEVAMMRSSDDAMVCVFSAFSTKSKTLRWKWRSWLCVSMVWLCDAKWADGRFCRWCAAHDFNALVQPTTTHMDSDAAAPFARRSHGDEWPFASVCKISSFPRLRQASKASIERK